MNAIEFTVNQLRIAAQYSHEEKTSVASKYEAKLEESKKEILCFLDENDGASALEVAEHFSKNIYTIRDRLQELAREEKIVLCMQAHNKPAIYRVKK